MFPLFCSIVTRNSNRSQILTLQTTHFCLLLQTSKTSSKATSSFCQSRS